MEFAYSHNYDDIVVTNLGFKISIIDLRKICFNKTYTIYGQRFFANTVNGVTFIRIELSRKITPLVAIRDDNTDVYTMFECSNMPREIIVN